MAISGGIVSIMEDSNLLYTMSMGWEKREGTFENICSYSLRNVF